MNRNWGNGANVGDRSEWSSQVEKMNTICDLQCWPVGRERVKGREERLRAPDKTVSHFVPLSVND